MIQPLAMLMNTFSSRVKYSKEIIKQYSEKINVIELNMDLDSKIVPLGWFLSDNARNSVKCYLDYLFDQSKAKLINDNDRTNISISDQYLSDYSYINELKGNDNKLSEEEKRKNYIFKIKGIEKDKKNEEDKEDIKKKKENDETNNFC